MVGNRVFGHTLILGIALALLLTPWGSFSLPPKLDSDSMATSSVTRAPSAPASPAPVAPTPSAATLEMINGLQGHVSIGQVKIAYWMIVACMAFGASTSILNLIGWTRLSGLLIFACFGIAAACSLVAIIDFSFKGQLGAGPVLAIVCALLGIAISPGEEPQTQVVIQPVEEARRQTRRAA